LIRTLLGAAVLLCACGGDRAKVAAADGGLDAASGGDGGGDAGPSGCPTDAEWDPAWAALEAEVLELVNATRASGADCQGTPAPPVGRVDMYGSLRSAARGHARDMAENAFVSLTGSDGSTFQERDRRCGYDGGGALGADLATDAPTAQDAMDRWLGTTPGCLLVMDVRFEEIGVGYQPPGIWVTAYGQP
jgi:uncharacterized protein YkwD